MRVSSTVGDGAGTGCCGKGDNGEKKRFPFEHVVGMMGLAFAEERNSLGTADNFCITLPGYIGQKSRSAINPHQETPGVVLRSD